MPRLLLWRDAQAARTSKKVDRSPQTLGSANPISWALADKSQGRHSMVWAWMQAIAEESLRYLGIWDRR